MTSKPMVAATAATFTVLALGAPAAAGPDRAAAGGDNGRHLGQSTAPGQAPAGPGAEGRHRGQSQHDAAKARVAQKQAQKQAQKRAEREARQEARRQGSSAGAPVAAPAASTTSAGAGDPAGNNGTVKIAGLGDLDGIPNNVAHPGCAFQVEWYGFDEGADVVSTVSFAMQAPTGDAGLTVDGPTQVAVGGDPASGAGTATGLDGVQAYTLTFSGEPHAQQGYHVKLTVSTPRSQGNDTKTKVFWVEDCTTAARPIAGQAGPVAALAGAVPTVESDSATVAVGGAAAVPQPVSATSSARPDPTTGAVLGITATRDRAAAPVPLAVEAGEQGSALGSLAGSPWTLAGLTGLLAAGGGALLRLRRRA